MTIHQEMTARKVSVAFTESEWVTIMLAIWDSVARDEQKFAYDKEIMWRLIDEKVALRDAIREAMESN